MIPGSGGFFSIMWKESGSTIAIWRARRQGDSTMFVSPESLRWLNFHVYLAWVSFLELSPREPPNFTSSIVRVKIRATRRFLFLTLAFRQARFR